MTIVPMNQAFTWVRAVCKDGYWLIMKQHFANGEVEVRIVCNGN